MAAPVPEHLRAKHGDRFQQVIFTFFNIVFPAIIRNFAVDIDYFSLTKHRFYV